MDVDSASSVPNSIGADGGDDGGGEGEAWPVQEVPEEECPPHLCLHLESRTLQLLGSYPQVANNIRTNIWQISLVLEMLFTTVFKRKVET